MGKNLISKITTDTFFYGITNYFSVIVAIILLPVYTRIFSKESYGVLDIFNVWNNFLVMVLPLGFYSGILRFYPDYKNDNKQRKLFSGTILNYFIFISIVFIIVWFLGEKIVLVNFMRLSLNESYIYNLSAIVVVEILFLEYLKTFFRMQFQRNRFLIVSLINFILLSSLGFGLVYFYHFGIEGFFIASVVALSVSNIVGFYFFKEQLSLSFNKKIFKEIFFYSIHFMSVSLLFKATDLIDRYLLNNFFSLVSVGEYAIAVKISNFYNILLSAVAFAWMPYVLSIKNDDKLKQTIKVFANLFILASIVLTSFIILFQKEILAFFAPNYLISGKLIPIIISYLFVNGFVYFFTLGIQLKKITRIFTYAAIFSVLTNVLSSIFLSKYFQESGIALGSLLGSVIWVAILFYFSQKKINIRYNYSLIISSLILYLLVVILSYFIDSIYLRVLLFGIVFLISMPIIVLIIKKNKIILDE